MADDSYNPLRAFSPDGQWIAGMDYREGPEIGVLQREDGSWHRVGRGRLVGLQKEHCRRTDHCCRYTGRQLAL